MDTKGMIDLYSTVQITVSDGKAYAIWSDADNQVASEWITFGGTTGITEHEARVQVGLRATANELAYWKMRAFDFEQKLKALSPEPTL